MVPNVSWIIVAGEYPFEVGITPEVDAITIEDDGVVITHNITSGGGGSIGWPIGGRKPTKQTYVEIFPKSTTKFIATQLIRQKLFRAKQVDWVKFGEPPSPNTPLTIRTGYSYEGADVEKIIVNKDEIILILKRNSPNAGIPGTQGNQIPAYVNSYMVIYYKSHLHSYSHPIPIPGII